MEKLKGFLLSPAVLLLLGALVLPVAWPLVALLVPIVAFAAITSNHSKQAPKKPEPQPIGSEPEPHKPSIVDPEFVSSTVHPISSGVALAEPSSLEGKVPVVVNGQKTAERKVPDTLDTASDKSSTGASSESNGKLAAAPATAAGGAAILARLRAQRQAQASAQAKQKEVVVLYASQTGTAQEIAKVIQAEAQSHGLKSKVASMNEFGFENLTPEKSPIVVMVASSTGDGDPPDNSARFYMALKRKTHANQLLKGVMFTCLGLGDSNYTRFCQVPRTLRSRFESLGAVEFYPSIDADEVDGIENTVDPWQDGLWPALQKAAKSDAQVETDASGTAHQELKGVPALPSCRVQIVWEDSEYEASLVQQQGKSLPSAEELSYRDPAGMYSAEQPFWAKVTDVCYLTTDKSEDRKVLHLELDISGSDMQYLPGDSIGVIPENADEMVISLIKRLKVKRDAVFTVKAVDDSSQAKLLPHLKYPCTVQSALKGVRPDVSARKSLLRLLAEHCSDPKEKHHLLLLCSRDGREAYNKEILEGKPTLLDLLDCHPSCQPPLDALLDALPALPARMYSVACSPLEVPTKVHVAFTIVHYESKYGQREGVATNWLERVCTPVLTGKRTAERAGIRVPIFLRRGGDFTPPETLEAPVIMIGPGTGVAPFRGFLQHRRAMLSGTPSGAAGECWLFFGCRREDEDFLYMDDLNALRDEGVLSKLVVAFSRAQAQKVYVQHLMKKNSKALYDLIINKEAYVFVCGDGAAMAKDVHVCLLDIVQTGGDIPMEEAVEVLSEMAKQKRYVKDIWS